MSSYRPDQSPDLRLVTTNEDFSKRANLNTGINANPLKRSSSNITKLKNKYSSIFIEKCLEQNITPSPEILEIIQSSNSDEILKIDLSKDHPSLEVITLCNSFTDYPKPFAMKFIETDLDENALESISQLLTANSNLKWLYLKGNHKENLSYLKIGDALNSKTCGLLELIINQIPLGDTICTKILQSLDSNKRLLRLGLNNVGLTDMISESICNFLRINNTITFISLEGNKISCNSIKKLIETLQENVSVKEMMFSTNPITNELFNILDDEFYSRIFDLNFKSCEITTYGIELMEKSVKMVRPKVETKKINFINNRLASAGAERLIKVINQVFPNLKYLFLDNNKIGNRFLDTLVNYAKHSLVERISLASNLIDENGTVYIPELFNGVNRNLKEINLRKNFISLEGQRLLVNELKKQNAELKVILSDQFSRLGFPFFDREEAYFNKKDLLDEKLRSMWADYMMRIQKVDSKRLASSQLETLFKNVWYNDKIDDCQMISEIRVDMQYLGREEMEFLAKFLTTVESVAKFIISPIKLNFEDFKVFCKILKDCEHIIYFGFAGCQLNTEVIPEIKDLLRARHTPLELQMHENFINDEGLLSLLEVFQNSRNKKTFSLKMGFNNLSERSIFSLSDCIKSGKINLTELSLDGNMILDDAIIELMISLQNCANLSKISLNQCGLTANSCPSIAELIARSNTLKVLRLEENMLEEEGVKQLLAGIRANKSLRCICLRKTSISEKGLRDIERTLADLTHLKEIKIDACEANIINLSQQILERKRESENVMILDENIETKSSGSFTLNKSGGSSSLKIKALGKHYQVETPVKSKEVVVRASTPNEKRQSESKNTLLEKNMNMPADQFGNPYGSRYKSSSTVTPNKQKTTDDWQEENIITADNISETSFYKVPNQILDSPLTGAHQNNRSSWGGSREEPTKKIKDRIMDGGERKSEIADNSRRRDLSEDRSLELSQSFMITGRDQGTPEKKNRPRSLTLMGQEVTDSELEEINKEIDRITHEIFHLIDKRKNLLEAKEGKLRKLEATHINFSKEQDIVDLKTHLNSLNFKFGDLFVQDIIRKNESVYSCSNLIGMIIENKHETHQEQVIQYVNSFYEKNSVVECNLDKVFGKITKVDGKIEAANKQFNLACVDLDKIELSIRTLLTAQELNHIQKAEPLFQKKNEIDEGLNSLMVEKNLLKNEKLNALNEAIQYLEELKRLREERLFLSERIISGSENEKKLDTVGVAADQLETILDINEKCEYLIKEEAQLKALLNGKANEINNLKKEFIKCINDQTDIFIKFQETVDANVHLKKLQELLLRENGLEKISNETIRYIILKLKSSIEFYKPFLEEESKIKESLAKTQDTFKKFLTIIKSEKNEQERKKELLVKLENCTKFRADEEDKIDQIRKIDVELTKKKQQKSHIEEDLENIMSEADLDSYKKMGFILTTQRESIHNLDKEKARLLEEIEKINREVVRQIKLIKKEYGDLLSEMFPPDSMKKLDLGKIQDIKSLKRNLIRTLNRMKKNI